MATVFKEIRGGVVVPVVLRARLTGYYVRLYEFTHNEQRILDPANIVGENFTSTTFLVFKNKAEAVSGKYRSQRGELAVAYQLRNGARH